MLGAWPRDEPLAQEGSGALELLHVVFDSGVGALERHRRERRRSRRLLGQGGVGERVD